jgi:spore coat polysaccharide biosynthesis protein SpsF (cytidylyltransferase family)
VDPADEAVAGLARALGVAACHGPVDDVLSRYVLAAREQRADVVVRITADCPLVDPRLIDRVVGRLLRDEADYASNILPPTYPDGYDVEAFTMACLTRIDAEATLAYEREHVTPRVREHPDAYRIATVRCRRDLSAIRLTVDVPGDLVRIASVLCASQGSALPGLGAVLNQLATTGELSRQAGLPQRDERYLAQRLAALEELRT